MSPSKRLYLTRSAEFFLPIILGVGILSFIGFLLEESLRFKYWPLMTAYFFPPLGKETIIPAGVAFDLDPLIMALSIAFIDVIVALFLVWNYDLVKKIPIIGKFIIKIEEKGKNVEQKYGWIKPLRFIGIVLFVMVPFQGSGGLVGSIVGRLIGMKPQNTFFAISIGAVVGCTLIAYFSEIILSVFVKNFLFGALIIIILLILSFMILAYKKMVKNTKNEKPA